KLSVAFPQKRRTLSYFCIFAKSGCSQLFSLRVKDAHRQEQQQSLYWPKAQTVQTVSSSSVRVGKHRT
ncbi:hypothetical protein, partial [Microcoleus sp. D3_18a_C4]|uniref:hypothetical protein n=1 Tax=Microcoleus sp. D3_18a_C4 TaxID=3055332 RepID=UPI002FD4DE64